MSTDDWCSPPEVAEPLEQLMGGPVDVDPCSNLRSIVRAKISYTAGGLHLPWGRTTYENPPYSRMLLWTAKGLAEIQRRNVFELVRLVPVATSAEWWRLAVGESAYNGVKAGRRPTIVFTKRLAFLDENGQAQGVARFDSALFYYGNRRSSFLREFKNITSWHWNG